MQSANPPSCTPTPSMLQHTISCLCMLLLPPSLLSATITLTLLLAYSSQQQLIMPPRVLVAIAMQCNHTHAD